MLTEIPIVVFFVLKHFQQSTRGQSQAPGPSQTTIFKGPEQNVASGNLDKSVMGLSLFMGSAESRSVNNFQIMCRLYTSLDCAMLGHFTY